MILVVAFIPIMLVQEGFGWICITHEIFCIISGYKAFLMQK